MSEAGASIGHDSSEDGKQSNVDTVSAQKEIEPLKIKTLADLIGLCRDRGYQVFNDKPNVPDADRLRMEALGEQGGNGGKKHRSDDRNPNLPRRSDRNKSGKGSLRFGFDRTSFGAGSATTKTDYNDVMSRKTSAFGSVYSRSQDTSRLSSAQGTYEIPQRNQDAEELLQQRMRKRSKRRRENRPGTLVDLIVQMSSQRHNTSSELTAESSSPDHQDSAKVSAFTTDSNVIVGKKSDLAKDTPEGNNMNGFVIADTEGKTRAGENQPIPDDDAKLKENADNVGIRKSQNLNLSSNHKDENIDNSPKYTLDNTVRSENEEVFKEQGKEAKRNSGGPISQRATSETEVKKEEIVDLDEQAQEDNDKNSMKKESEENTVHTTSNDNIDKHQTGSSATNEKEDIKNDFQNTHSDTDLKEKERAINEGSENVIDEVRIKDGHSTLVLYKVKEKTLLSLGRNSENVTWSQKDKRHENGTKDESKNGPVPSSCNKDYPISNRNKHISNSEAVDEKQFNNNNTDLGETVVESRSDETDTNIIIDERSLRDDGSETKAVIQQSSEDTAANHENETSQDHRQSVKLDESDIHKTIRRDDLDTEKEEMSEETTECSPPDMADETSIKSEMLSTDARLILLVETAKKTNEENSKDHLKTIEMFKETRQSIIKDFKTTYDVEDEEGTKEDKEEETEEICKQERDTSDKNESEQLEPLEDIPKEGEALKRESEEIHDDKMLHESQEFSEESVKETKPENNVAVKQGQKFSEKKLQAIRDRYWRKDSNNSETFELDGEEFYLDPNGDLVKSIKQNASKKVDTRWDPEHAVFRKKINKDKSTDLKVTAHAEKVSKTPKISTADIPTDNVYVQEAKRIFPQGFDNVNEASQKNSTTNRKGKMVVKPVKSVDSGSPGNEENNTLTKFNVETTENGQPVKRKLKRIASVSSKKTATKIGHKEINEGKTKHTRSTKANNFVSFENESETDTSDKSNTERKHRIKTKRKNTKLFSDNHELEIDHAFLKDHKIIKEKAHGVGKAKNRQNNAEKPIKTRIKRCLPKIEFKSKEKENMISSTSNINSEVYRDIDDGSSFEMDDTSDQKTSVNRKDSKRLSNGLLLNNASRVSIVSGKSEGSMSTAVEIVQSRTNFYNGLIPKEEKNVPRENRVYKLFKEIQRIRRQTTPTKGSTPSLSGPSKSLISDPNSGFLFVNYNKPSRCLSEQGDNSDLDKFLYGSLDYDVCSKVRHVNSNYRRRVKAFGTLKQKMYINS